MWPQKQRFPTAEEMRKVLDRNPEGAAPRGLWGDPEFPREGVRAQPDDEGHAVRRLPRPRLELPRRVQARPQGQSARCARPRASARTIRRNSRRPCISRPSTWTWACNAWTATSRRTITATATCTAKSRRPWKWTARIAMDRCALSEPAHQWLRRGPVRHGYVRAAQRRRQAPLRVGRRQADPALGRDAGPRVDPLAREGQRDPRQPALQREGGAREADVRRHQDAEVRARIFRGTSSRTATTTWSATAATRRGPPAAAAATCPSRRTGRPAAIATKAASRATTPPTTRKWRAMTSSCSADAGPPRATRSRRCGHRQRWCCHLRTRIASASTCSSRRSRPRATARRR